MYVPFWLGKVACLASLLRCSFCRSLPQSSVKLILMIQSDDGEVVGINEQLLKGERQLQQKGSQHLLVHNPANDISRHVVV